jgi:hypothetical protein
MKKTLLIALPLIAAVSAFGQGQFNFSTKAASATLGTVNAPVYGVNPAAPGQPLRGLAATNGGSIDYTGVPLLSGTGFSAAIYGGDAPGTLAFIAQTTFRTQLTLLGHITPPTGAAPSVAGVPAGGTASMQLRAWDNKSGTVTTWAAALADNSVAKGQSDVFTSLPLGGGTLQPPNLQGLTSFNLTIVPEPGVIALGVLGLGALLLRRRK